MLNSQNALHGDLGILSDGDAVIALSYSGETPELLDLLPFVKRFAVNTHQHHWEGRVNSRSQHSDATLLTSVAAGKPAL